MTIGAALFTIAAGGGLPFAVTAEVAGIDLQIVRYILLATGVLGLVIGRWGSAAGAAPAHRHWGSETGRGVRCVTPACVAAARPH